MQISSLESLVHIPKDFNETLNETINKHYSKSKQFIIVDENTKEHCLPVLEKAEAIKDYVLIETKSGEENKSVETMVLIWEHLSQQGGDRKSLVINLGGGLLCDIGGFAASTFKRGVDFINIPTTLLAQVDASVGGKLAINFNKLKNEIGLFKAPNYVFINSDFLSTLSQDNILSGFAEMIKHALIFSKTHFQSLSKFEINGDINFESFTNHISRSIFIKNEFVRKDPIEKNIRKALNFGHTIGHALESFLLYEGRPELHGFAVAQGMVVESYLSYLKCGMSEFELDNIVKFIMSIYPKAEYTSNDFDTLYGFMTHDKKNEGQVINFTLLKEIGGVLINQSCEKDEIYQALEYYMNL